MGRGGRGEFLPVVRRAGRAGQGRAEVKEKPGRAGEFVPGGNFGG